MAASETSEKPQGQLKAPEIPPRKLQRQTPLPKLTIRQRILSGRASINPRLSELFLSDPLATLNMNIEEDKLEKEVRRLQRLCTRPQKINSPHQNDSLWQNQPAKTVDNKARFDTLYKIHSNGPEKDIPANLVDAEAVQVSADEVERIAGEEIRQKLDEVVRFDGGSVKLWCNEISRSLRGKFIKLTDNQRKVVVTTYIVPKLSKNIVGVHAECQKHKSEDDFVIVAVEGKDMFIWVNIFLSSYS